MNCLYQKPRGPGRPPKVIRDYDNLKQWRKDREEKRKLDQLEIKRIRSNEEFKNSWPGLVLWELTDDQLVNELFSVEENSEKYTNISKILESRQIVANLIMNDK
jgi:hypothetical protein